MTRTVGVDDFVAAVLPLTRGRVDRAALQQLLGTTAIRPAELDGLARFAEGRYTRHLVHRSEDVEILVLAWPPGARAPIHGHEGELCWARVERGRLRFTAYRERSRQPLRLEPLGPAVDGGRGHVDGPADIHAVENPAGGAPAVTVHVYCRPYEECDIYDLERGVVRRVRLAYDSVRGAAGGPLSGRC
jgi:NitT/TauT family transport system ATP-binding protein